MIIKDIKYTGTNKTRTDDKYPMRIGCEVEFLYEFPIIGKAMYLEYIADNQGYYKDGYIHTTKVEKIEETETEIVVTTRNSVYCLEK